MSDEEDDYLSDKFLVELTTSATATGPKTYSDRRKETLRRGVLKNEQDRAKSHRERAQEARDDALGRSLFERAQEEMLEGGQQNKALAMMMKMGFQPGQALGTDGGGRVGVIPAAAEGDGETRTGDPHARMKMVPGEEEEEEEEEEEGGATGREPARAGIGARRPAHDAPGVESETETPCMGEGTSHRTVPLALNEWQGKKGIGLRRKRAGSPSASERVAKMARMAEERAAHASFRGRTRQDYEERRAAGRLQPAQRTCSTLDEQAGVQFNVLWLNPENPEAFPDGLLDALDDPALVASIQRQRADRPLEGRLGRHTRRQADALGPLKSSFEDVDVDEQAETDTALPKPPQYSEEQLEEALQFLRLGAQDRLALVLDYLRRKYTYCFWCGTRYGDEEDMANTCPGEDEDSHD